MFSNKLKSIINKDAYTREWRTKTAICLLAIGMSESGIEECITGNITSMRDCHNICNAQGVNFNEVWPLIK